MRNRNEDAALIPPDILQGRNSDPITAKDGSFTMLAVADGLGGHSHGDLASRTALHALLSSDQPFHRKQDLNELAAYLASALEEAARETEGAFSMATALTVLHISEESIHIINCGDCRVYDVLEGTLLTRDHTMVFESYLRNELTLEELRIHPMKNRLLRCVQATSGIPELELRTISHVAGKRYLMASDGIWEAIPHEKLMEKASESSLQQACSIIRQSYFESGARDNGTLILIQL